MSSLLATILVRSNENLIYGHIEKGSACPRIRNLYHGVVQFVLCSVMPSQGDGHPRVLPVTLIFDLLHLLALILLILITLSALSSRRVHRMRTWYSFLLSWIIYTVSFLLLPFRSPGFEPDKASCLFQASMIYAMPPTYVVLFSVIYLLICDYSASWAGLCFVIEVGFVPLAREWSIADFT